MTNKRGGRLLEEIWYAFYDYNLTLTLLRSTQTLSYNTAQKMKFSIKDFFSKCDQICSCGFGHIYWRNP